MKLTKQLQDDLLDYLPEYAEKVKKILEANTSSTAQVGYYFAKHAYEIKLGDLVSELPNCVRHLEVDQYNGGVISAVTIGKVSIAYHTAFGKWAVLPRHRTLQEDWV